MSERISDVPDGRRVLAAVAASLGIVMIGGLIAAETASAEIDRAEARAEMRAIYASMQVLLPLSVDDAAFRNSRNERRIRAALQTLAERAEQVAGHVGGGDRRIQYLAGSLARESWKSLGRFDVGEFDGAQFYLRQLTDFCVACHSGLPSPADSSISRDFVSEKTLASLPLAQRAEIQIATRRFDDALSSLETVFASSREQPAELLGPLTDYLTVAIRVKNDLERPRPVLARLAARPDLWTNLRSDLVRWQETLARHAHDPAGPPSLASARALLAEANQVMGYPTDRQGLVHNLLASSQLLRYLEAHAGETSRDVAEAHYLLGLIESRTSLESFTSEADFHLETAIRMAPRDPVGAEAFRLLEEETVVGWSGSGGTHMPEDVRRNLESLRKMVHPGKAALGMRSDVEIAQAAQPRPIAEIATRLGLVESDLVPYGRDVAKVELAALRRPRPRGSPARLVLVSAITPTPAGEGKTTTSIGLADGLARLGQSVCLALREPSLGPALGLKGGATGGGHAQIIPMERINLHFTGDFHAITAANNLLAALIDNHLHHGNALDIDPRRVVWRRVMDLNDRALRQVVVGLGGPANGVPRETGFDITAASEVMAILCLAEDLDDLRARLDRILVGFDRKGEPVRAKALAGTGAMLALLADALKPNLVQTLEGTPAFVHGGPFANIAHGCNSVLATRLALHQADWAITEAGFGFDLGAEKFFDIKCAGAGLDPAAVVLVATVRALKLHGGVSRDALSRPDPAAVERGLPNLEKHVESIRHFGESPIVALNHFAADTAAEIEVVERCCASLGVPFAVAQHHAQGGAGAEAVARAVLAHAEQRSRPFRALYAWSDPVARKIEAVATKMYGARGVRLTKSAQHDLAEVERLGYAGLPVCIAKIPSSLSDDARLAGRPRDFELTVRAIQINAGAGFLVVLTGDILRMPGMPARPLAESIDVRDGRIVGLE